MRQGLNYLGMEYVSGTDLSVLIGQSAPLEEKLALTIIADSARGLVGAHERGIIHRDIKPANILLAGEGIREDPTQINPKSCTL